MKKMLALALMAGLLVAAVAAHAQVYEKGMNMFEMAGKIKNYDAYDAPKDDGLIGRLYVYPHGKDETDSKKLYITKETEIVKKDGPGSPADLTAGAVVLVRYKKVNDDMLKVTKVELK